ncbi:hypothetical protein MWU78_19485 [Arenibacter sp. F26102]|uniref:hypothetical protein n=1 Tax=Arenibacter sp. F26102 TaxID=2926416 RepID=UPI001FF1882F|nr:hypothetical protein [Arenibacter sp. F26102]MCK0147843.1 hypothetical protein [Arenibacter sp. F26102]
MKSKMKSCLIIASFLGSLSTLAQEKPIRIGVKIGYPNALGGNIEYVTPLLGKKLAPSIEYSTLSPEKLLEIEKFDYSYLQFGFNYYFFKPGKGLYSNLSYGILKTEIIDSGYSSDTDYNKTGTGYVKLLNKSVNLKLGAKLGSGFYFRPEIGYALTPVPEFLDTTVKFSDGTSEVQQESISPLNSGLMFNFGFGAAF